MMISLRTFALSLLLAASLPAASQAPATPSGDPLAPLGFLLGTWTAKTNAPAGTSAADSSGTYTFHLDLNGHAIERTSSADTCKAPTAFDCAHHDRLTVFSDANALAAHHASLLAFYMDSEGHIIYYTIALPDPHTAIFTSQNAPGSPKFRLVYHLEGDGTKAILSGKFQFAPPGTDDYHSYLEWSGTKQ